MKRSSAYATAILSLAVLAAGGCRNKDDHDMQPGASNPASPATAPATTPPPVNPNSPNPPPAGSQTNPGSSATAPAPSTTSAR